MKNNFIKVVDKYLSTLEQYVPIVARVHGGNHPEFHKVHRVFDTIVVKVKTSVDSADLSNDFSQLREITDNYFVPSDVCETFDAVYKMLAEIDSSYNN